MRSLELSSLRALPAHCPGLSSPHRTSDGCPVWQDACSPGTRGGCRYPVRSHLSARLRTEPASRAAAEQESVTRARLQPLSLETKLVG